MPEIAGISPKQHKALAALLSESTIAAAATKAGVAERTLYGWLQEPAFSEEYRRLRREAIGQAMARLQQVSSGMVSVLIQLAADKHTPPSVRFQAAAKVLELCVKWIETEDHEQRLAALEQAYDQQTH